MIGFILLFIAKILSSILFPLGWLYSLLTLRVKVKKLDYYAYKIALSIDQLGNVVMSNLFNDILIKKEGYKFGDEDETISCVLGVNKYLNKLTFLGFTLSSFLNYLDENHVEKASYEIVKKIKKEMING